MFVSDKLVGLFQIAKETVDELRLEVSTLRVQNSSLDRELASLKVTNEWMRHKINGLEIEKAALLGRDGIKLASIPEIAAQPRLRPEESLATLNFDHISDEDARKLGIEHLLS